MNIYMAKMQFKKKKKEKKKFQDKSCLITMHIPPKKNQDKLNNTSELQL